jgi:hypothetical protein
MRVKTALSTGAWTSRQTVAIEAVLLALGKGMGDVKS